MTNKNKGFTLIELLVVIFIIGILAGLALVSFQGAKKTARDGKRKVDLEQIRSALEMCYADTSSYPASIYNSVSCDGQTYLEDTPKDPKTSANYSYSRPSPAVYNLCAQLETADDDWCVTNP